MLCLIDLESELIWVFHIHEVARLEKRVFEQIWSLREGELDHGFSAYSDIVFKRIQLAFAQRLSRVSKVLNEDFGTVIFQKVTNVVFEILLEK